MNTRTESTFDRLHLEVAKDEALIECLEAWMLECVEPPAAVNRRLLGFLMKAPLSDGRNLPSGSFMRVQRIGASYPRRRWASFSTSEETIRLMSGVDTEVIRLPAVRGLSLATVGYWRTRLTGVFHEYATQQEWLVATRYLPVR